MSLNNSLFTVKNTLLFLVTLVTILLLANRLFLIYSYSTDLAGIEPVFIYYIVSDFMGIPIYTDLNQIPYTNCQYVPFYFNILSDTLKLLGWSESKSITDIYIIARSVNLLLNISGSILIGLLVVKIYKIQRYWAYIIACLSFWTYSTYFFAARPDSLKTFFLLLTVYFYFKSIQTKKILSFDTVAFITFSTLAFYTKQDALIIIASLLLVGAFNNLKKWLVIGSGLLLLDMGALSFLYKQFGDNLISNLSLGFKFKYSYEYFIMVFGNRYYHWIFTIFLIAILSFFIREKDKDISSSWISPVILFSFPLIILISFKWGAGVNYYLDLILLTYLLLPSFLKTTYFKEKETRFFVLVCIFSSAFLYTDIKSENISIQNLTKEQKYRNDFKELLAVKDKLIKHSNSDDFYLYTFEKSLCNEFPKSCLFPAYETSDPQFLLSTSTYFSGDTDMHLSVYPEIKVFKDTSFIRQISVYPVYAIMPKPFGFLPYYDITESNFEMIDSTHIYYIYKLRNKIVFKK